ncbi:MAG: hypothetical protein A2W91_04880 [Bacteroidetes bacterium GWF2_38_335]|nr:MAG: hypothetical protein A2W91_04880 [Bacteroidetes bacterium GWF2_38_335]OFY79835.1 MAG: hypothetical protein A2281_10540 [Bacteroidetes bacterium RIFOXYA12_FULL_38_20]
MNLQRWKAEKPSTTEDIPNFQFEDYNSMPLISLTHQRQELLKWIFLSYCVRVALKFYFFKFLIIPTPQRQGLSLLPAGIHGFSLYSDKLIKMQYGKL